MVAQRYPADFDGILAGDPGNDWSHWAAGLVWSEQALFAIPDTKRELIQKAVMATCDALDGVLDGLISDPRLCHFDPAVLTCKGIDAPNCLTPTQVAALRKIHDGPKNPRTGERIFVGFPPGVLVGPGRPDFGDSYFGQVVLEQKSWDPRTLDFDQDIALSDRKSSPVVDAINPDLRAFRDHGGKLIQYHGWADALMPAGGSIVYYERVKALMDSKSFYRLFMIPGMGHCYGGAGPTSIAATEALERWVEGGIAPAFLVGSGQSPQDPTKIMSRPICPYPQTTRYKGKGDTNDATNFECAARPE